jgi:hypothetical protein
MAESRPPGSDAFEKRRVAPYASEPPVTAPSTRRRVLLWRAASQPQATPLPGRRVEDRGPRANGDEVSAANRKFLESRVGRLALGVLVGALLALASDVGDAGDVSVATRGDVSATLSSPSLPPAGGAVAFLFLTRGPAEGRKALPHDHLWSRFFRGQDRATFLVRVHAPPGFAFTDENTDAPEVFKGTELRDPVHPVAWGTVSIVKAEQALLRSALRCADPVASAFALLSESCVPIRAFPFTRAYLLDGEDAFSKINTADGHHDGNHEQTRVGNGVGVNRRRQSFAESSPDRHARWPGFRDADAAAALPRRFWRKGSQWFALTRRHAEVVAADVVVVEAFGRYCSTGVSTGAEIAISGDVSEGGDGKRGSKTKRFCAPDEHFVPTLLAMRGLETELEPRSVTYANWWPTKRWHPKRFAAREASADAIRAIANKTETDDAFEGGGVSCGWYASGTRAGAKRPCWLFARKFTEKAGRRIGAFASVVIGF